MTIAIAAAGGQLGRLAIADLKPRLAGRKLVALLRDPAKGADLGVETRRADYHQPASLQAALEGVERLVLISSNDFNDRAGQHRNAIEAAKAQGVGHVIYTSILKCSESPLALAADHKATEAALRDSGLSITLLRNGWYTENYTAGLPGALEAGVVVGGAGAGRVSTAARADYAAAIAAVALDPAHDGETYELAGDESYTLAELAAEVSRQSGRQIPYKNMPQGPYTEFLTLLGLPEGFARAVADSDAWAAKGWLFDTSSTLRRLIGRPTTPMPVSVAAALPNLRQAGAA